MGRSEQWEADGFDGAASDNYTGGYELNDHVHLDLAPALSHFFGDDPDSNPYINVNLSKFYDVANFIKNFKNLTCPIILNINIQGLHSKFNGLKDFIQELSAGGIFILAITLQEIWQIVDPCFLQLDNFAFISTARKNSRGGGVGIYIRSGLSAKINQTLSPFLEGIFETISIDFKFKTKQYTISSIYRPPNNTADSFNLFFANLENFLHNMSRLNQPYYIFTDSNINLLKLANNIHAQQYLETLHSNGFLQLVTKATRIIGPTYSLIDHVCCKNENSKLSAGVIPHDLSDHFFTFLSLENESKPLSHTELSYRDFSKNNLDEFKSALSNIGWESVLSLANADLAFNEFWETFSSLFDIYFPIKTKKLNKNIHKIQNFLTSGLLKSRTTKIALHKLSISHPTDDNIAKYKTYRNLYNTLLRKSKILHYQDQLSTNVKNPKKM